MALTLPRSMPSTPTTRLRSNPASPWRHLDLVLLGAVVATAALGTLMVYSATRGPTPPYDLGFFKKQALFTLIGLGLMLLTTLIDYRNYREWAPVLYGGAVAGLLLVVSPAGSSSKGAQAWFQLGAFQLQPAEFAKIATILTLAGLGAHYRAEVDHRRLGTLLALAAAPIALIMLQPDLGTAMVIVAAAAGILLVAGASSRHLLVLVVVAVLGTTVLLQTDLLEQYQKDRLTVFLDQDSGRQGAAYNIDQSKTAIGSGGFLGRGLFEGSQTRLGNVPEQHTDFIFTAVGEQLGFIGSATLLLLFCLIAWRVWRAATLARDSFGVLLSVGVLCMLMFQIFENVGMTMGIMPVTGIPLPFVSYGGSSTIAQFIGIGLVLNVVSRRFS